MKYALILCVALTGCSIPITKCNSDGYQFRTIPNIYGDMNVLYEKCSEH